MKAGKAKRTRKRGNRYPPGTVIHFGRGQRLIVQREGRNGIRLVSVGHTSIHLGKRT